MRTSTGPVSPSRVRVSLREVREVAYRALVAHGACPGRAPAAAEQVLEAELHHGAGLTGLLADLARGPWDGGGLDLRADERGGRTLLRVDSPDAAAPLRVGQLVADLASAAGTVHVPALRDDGPLAAAALIGAAAAGGHALALVGSLAEAWIATPDGALLRLDRMSVLGDWEPPPDGSVVLVVDPPPDLDPHPRAARRRSAAREGLLVDAAAFARAYDAARAYLVPER
ncbi:hypothetical protein GCM10023066_15000 [Nocardioides kongjuensis]